MVYYILTAIGFFCIGFFVCGLLASARSAEHTAEILQLRGEVVTRKLIIRQLKAEVMRTELINRKQAK